jgi:hypothetical protein
LYIAQSVSGDVLVTFAPPGGGELAFEIIREPVYHQALKII